MGRSLQSRPARSGSREIADNKNRHGQVADSPPILGVSAVANIHYGRQILIGVRNYCETSGAAEMNYLSEDGSIPAQADPGTTFKAIVAHLGNRRELARARLLATAVVCTSSRNLGMNVPYVVTDGRARELPADPAFPVGEISQLTGFADQRMLAKVFKRETGLTPSEYRNCVK